MSTIQDINAPVHVYKFKEVYTKFVYMYHISIKNMIDDSGQDKQVKGYGKNNNCMWDKLGAIALRAIKSRSVNVRDEHKF